MTLLDQESVLPRYVSFYFRCKFLFKLLKFEEFILIHRNSLFVPFQLCIIAASNIDTSVIDSIMLGSNCFVICAALRDFVSKSELLTAIFLTMKACSMSLDILDYTDVLVSNFALYEE